MTGLIARILLRYVAGMLVAKGVFAPGDADFIFGDPELAGVVEMAIGGLIVLAVEGAYLAAKRLGWRT